MYRGTASKEMVVAMAKGAKMLGFLGAAGMSLEEMEKNIKYIQGELKNGEAYGMNLLHNLVDPSFEMKTVELFLRYKIQKSRSSSIYANDTGNCLLSCKGIKKR